MTEQGVGGTPTASRLRFVAVDGSATDDLVTGLLAVALSNPDFLATHEGTEDGPGTYTREMLERDLAVAQLDPLRQVWALDAAGTVVGWVDTLDEHPRDHVPWIGLLEIHSDHQRRGYGREAAGAVRAHYLDQGCDRLRLGVDDGNDAALAFWESLGYVPVDRRSRPAPTGRLGVTVLEA